MPDGTAWRGPTPALGDPWRGQGWRTATAAGLAVALHGAALLPFLWAPAPHPAPSVVEAVEMAPMADSVPASEAPAEPVQSSVAPPEALRAEAAPQPATAPTPPDTAAAERPPEPVLAERPPEPERATEPPPEPVTAEAEAPVEAVPPPEAVAAIPPPPPPPPAAPRAPSRAAPSAPAEARSPAPAAPAAPAPSPPRVGQPSASYVGALLAALDRHKEYPSAARWRRAEGVALLRFTMRRDGSVVGWRVVRSTGHGDLDAAVEQMIRRASPLPAPPPELPGDPVELVVPVRFSLR